MSFKDKLPKRRAVGHWFAPVWIALALEDAFTLLEWIPDLEPSWVGVVMAGLVSLGILAMPKETAVEEKTETNA